MWVGIGVVVVVLRERGWIEGGCLVWFIKYKDREMNKIEVLM